MKVIVGGLIEKQGKFLLVQEAKEKCRGKWNIPAGGIEENETVLEGAKREVFEETGYKIELTGLLPIINRNIENTDVLIFTFTTKILNENLTFNTDEILDVKWLSFEEIVNKKEELRDEYILDTIKAYLENKETGLDIIKTV